jgi:hypothetical protein
MKTLVDARLLDEATRFTLRFACEDCAHFNQADTECSHGYPTSLHRRARLETGTELAFCKEFELGVEME